MKENIMDRASGVLLHPTSLPGFCAVGGMGEFAYQFIDYLQEAGQKLWQILPLGPTGYGNSPYQCYSAFAGNPLLIDMHSLRNMHLLTESEIVSLISKTTSTRIDFDQAHNQKSQALTIAFQRFTDSGGLKDTSYCQFCNNHRSWLDDYALFQTVKSLHGGAPWYNWSPEIRMHNSDALDRVWNEHAVKVDFHRFQQFIFFQQWQAIREHAKSNGIRIIGDLPIFVASDSADVWSHPEIFKLDTKGHPSSVAGVPPDYFSEDGQLWGNPIYNWDVLRETNYEWWAYRFRMLYQMVDIIRIDHFRGFEQYWEVPAGDTTARNGSWQPGPGAHFFERILPNTTSGSIIAEDLGVITTEVELLRDRFGFPGMKILQFAFDSDAANPYLPHNFSQNCVVYTGTHDNNTSRGWYEELCSSESESAQRTVHRLRDYLGHEPEDIGWEFLALAHRSIARWSIVPMQDILGLGADARMNLPGTVLNNWNWRLDGLDSFRAVIKPMRQLTDVCGRI